MRLFFVAATYTPSKLDTAYRHDENKLRLAEKLHIAILKTPAYIDEYARRRNLSRIIYLTYGVAFRLFRTNNVIFLYGVLASPRRISA